MPKKKKDSSNRNQLLKQMNELKDSLSGFNSSTDTLLGGVKPKSIGQIEAAINLLTAQRDAIVNRINGVYDFFESGPTVLADAADTFMEEKDNAEAWAYIKRYYELVRDGFIQEENILDRYEAGAFVEHILTSEERKEIVQEAEKKREELIARHESLKKTAEQRREMFKDLINF